MTEQDVREVTSWSDAYHPEWDDTPQRYSDEGVVQWGRSRRLGVLELGRLKAYIGVQHIDPSLPGWGFVDEPQTRFFVSMFQAGQTVGLRTFPRVSLALQAVMSFVSAATGRR